MQSLSPRGMLVITLSLLLALVLSVLPLPKWALLFYPQWLPLVLLYWAIALPHRVSLGVAWLLGLLLDGLYGTVLGEHALALTVITFVAGKLYRQIRMFPILQQAFSMMMLIVLYQVILMWIQGIMGSLQDVRWFWVSAVVSMLFWPWVYTILRSCRRRFSVY